MDEKCKIASRGELIDFLFTKMSLLEDVVRAIGINLDGSNIIFAVGDEFHDTKHAISNGDYYTVDTHYAGDIWIDFIFRFDDGYHAISFNASSEMKFTVAHHYSPILYILRPFIDYLENICRDEQVSSLRDASLITKIGDILRNALIAMREVSKNAVIAMSGSNIKSARSI